MSSEKYTLVEGGIFVKTRLSETIDEPYELFIDATTVRRGEDQQDREEKARRILKFLDESNIGHDWRPGQVDADLEIQIGYERRGYGVFGMMAELNRPTVSDDVATVVTTRAMQQMAHDIGMHPDKRIPEWVYAQVSQSQGITLETNPAASASMDTDGNEYEETSERIALHAHNLYSHEMQLVCIAGLIALAQAR